MGIRHWGVSVFALALISVTPANAQSSTPGETDAGDIIVTAQKKSESLQRVPLSISALSGETLEAQGITDFRDYATRIPNLAFGYTGSLGGTAQSVTLRGVFGSGTTGFYLDEAPLPASIDPRVIDMERIEVLRGPQGTLYGARSMGGTIRLITRKPDATTTAGTVLARLSTTAHGGENGSIDGAINLPLIQDRLALRASGYFEAQSGVYDRVAAPGAPTKFGTIRDVDNSRRYGGSIAATATLADGALTVTPRFMFQRGRADGRALADVVAGNYRQTRLFDIAEPGRDNWNLATLTIDYDTRKGTITAATSWLHRIVRDSEDFSEIAQLVFGTPPIAAVMRARSRFESLSQELRYASDFDGPLNLTAGLYYQDIDNSSVFPPTPLPGVAPNVYSQDFVTKVRELAAFGEMTYAATDHLRLIAGARLFDSRVDFTGVQDGVAVVPGTFWGRQKEHGINPRVSVQYDAARDAMLYASAAKGFRIGGVNAFSGSLCAANLTALGIGADDARAYRSDSLWSYEVGAKTRWLDRKLTVNAALFRIDWSNVQQGISLACGFGVLVNAGKAKSEGGELEVQAAPFDGLRLNFGAGYTNARITDGGGNPTFPDGARIQQVPQWTVNTGFDLDLDPGFPLKLHADYAYVGQSFSGSSSPLTRRVRPSYDLFNVRATTQVSRVELSLFADNLFDEAANLSDLPSLAIELPGRPRIVGSRPRTIGVEGRIRF
jgi:iron complex outermembrane receptor protein